MSRIHSMSPLQCLEARPASGRDALDPALTKSWEPCVPMAFQCHIQGHTLGPLKFADRRVFALWMRAKSTDQGMAPAPTPIPVHHCLYKCCLFVLLCFINLFFSFFFKASFFSFILLYFSTILSFSLVLRLSFLMGPNACSSSGPVFLSTDHPELVLGIPTEWLPDTKEVLGVSVSTPPPFTSETVTVTLLAHSHLSHADFLLTLFPALLPLFYALKCLINVLPHPQVETERKLLSRCSLIRSPHKHGTPISSS